MTFFKLSWIQMRTDRFVSVFTDSFMANFVAPCVTK